MLWLSIGIFCLAALILLGHLIQQAQAGGAEDDHENVGQGPQIRGHTAEDVDARTRAARRARLASLKAEHARSASIARWVGRVDEDERQWLPRREWIASIDNPAIPAGGKWARFEYVDADGVVTQRHIRQWSKRGAYIEGFCMDRRDNRTFRQDRISVFRYG